MRNVIAGTALVARPGWQGLFFSGLLLLSGCASGPPLHDWPTTSETQAIPAEITEVPFFAQERYQCGPAALAGVLNWSGIEITPDELTPYLYIPERQGTLQPELLAQSRRLGRIPYVIPPHPDALLEELRARHPVLVLQNNGVSWYPKWHYAVVVGVESDEDGDEQVVLRSGDMQRYPLDAGTFMNTWRRSHYWGVVVLPPDRLPASVDANGVLRAIDDFSRTSDFEAVMTALEAAARRWPGDLGIHFALGNHLYASGDIEGAERTYRGILARHPGTAIVHNNLAWLLAEQGRLDEAQEEIGHAQSASPGRHDEEIRHTAAFIDCRSNGGSTNQCQREAVTAAGDGESESGEKLGNSSPD